MQGSFGGHSPGTIHALSEGDGVTPRADLRNHGARSRGPRSLWCDGALGNRPNRLHRAGSGRSRMQRLGRLLPRIGVRVGEGVGR